MKSSWRRGKSDSECEFAGSASCTSKTFRTAAAGPAIATFTGASAAGSLFAGFSEDPPTSSAEGRRIVTEEEIRNEIEKRLTMNWLIQGASQHVGMTLHHLIKDELEAVHPKLPLWYDQLALMNQLQWWRPLPVLLFGWPTWWWRRAGRSRRHPFFKHPLLAKYGGALAEASRRRAIERGKSKKVWRWPMTFTVQNMMLVGRLRRCEQRAPELITGAACRAASLAWGIDAARFRPQLVFAQSAIPAFAGLRPTRSFRAAMFRAGAIAWGGVTRDQDGELCVRAVAINGYFLSKELVKGTAELICLHGLGTLDDATYEQVMRATDRIELEPAMLQSGAELWRRLLLAIPQTINPAELLMRLAQSSNATVTAVLSAAIEESADAQDRVRSLCDAAPDDA